MRAARTHPTSRISIRIIYGTYGCTYMTQSSWYVVQPETGNPELEECARSLLLLTSQSAQSSCERTMIDIPFYRISNLLP